jgi:hypothetical protein
MNKKLNGNLGPKLVGLVEERNQLIAAYETNHRARPKLQCDLDRLTYKNAELTGLEPRAYSKGGVLDPLKGLRE